MTQAKTKKEITNDRGVKGGEEETNYCTKKERPANTSIERRGTKESVRLEWGEKESVKTSAYLRERKAETKCRRERERERNREEEEGRREKERDRE